MEKPFLVMIDDEQDILELLRYNFVRKGYEVKIFTNGEDAWKYIHNRRPDIILCDWMMPGINGLDFCKRIKQAEEFAQIPLVMVTCKGEKNSKLEAFAAGVTDYIVKPVKVYELVSRVEQLLSVLRSNPGRMVEIEA